MRVGASKTTARAGKGPQGKDKATGLKMAADTLVTSQATRRDGSSKSSSGGILGDVEGGASWLFGKAKAGLTDFSHGVQFLVYGVSYAPFKTRKVTSDPSDANHPSYQDITDAEQQTQASAAAEAAAVAKLSPADQKKYAQLIALTGPTAYSPQGWPVARHALQQMLLSGQLTGQKDLASGNRLLDDLSTLATEPLAKGVDRGDLLSETAIEVQDPSCIDQQAKGTCVATTASILLARLHPAEYVRLVAGLATPEGKVEMAGGDTLSRVSDWANQNDGDRTTSQRLLIPALMNDGELPLTSYDNSTDKTKLAFLSLPGGLMGGGAAHINSQLEGRPYQNHDFFIFDRGYEWNKVKQALAQGKGPIPVGVIWSDSDGNVGGHELQIDKIANGTVYYVNPWGDDETMSESEFEKHIDSAQIPA